MKLADIEFVDDIALLANSAIEALIAASFGLKMIESNKCKRAILKVRSQWRKN